MDPWTLLTVVLLLVVAAVAWLVVVYNRLVRLRMQVREGWSGIDVQLRRRHDLVPSLVAVVEAYRDFERDVLVEVTEARSGARGMLKRGGAEEAAEMEQRLADRVRSLYVLVEAYPALKADRRFAELSRELVETEDLLQHARRYYNGAVRDYNTAVQRFPDLLIASVFGFAGRSYFEMESDLRDVVPGVVMTA